MTVGAYQKKESKNTGNTEAGEGIKQSIDFREIEYCPSVVVWKAAVRKMIE